MLEFGHKNKGIICCVLCEEFVELAEVGICLGVY